MQGPVRGETNAGSRLMPSPTYPALSEETWLSDILKNKVCRKCRARRTSVDIPHGRSRLQQLALASGSRLIHRLTLKVHAVAARAVVGSRSPRLHRNTFAGAHL